MIKCVQLDRTQLDRFEAMPGFLDSHYMSTCGLHRTLFVGHSLMFFENCYALCNNHTVAVFDPQTAPSAMYRDVHRDDHASHDGLCTAQMRSDERRNNKILVIEA